MTCIYFGCFHVLNFGWFGYFTIPWTDVLCTKTDVCGIEETKIIITEIWKSLLYWDDYFLLFFHYLTAITTRLTFHKITFVKFVHLCWVTETYCYQNIKRAQCKRFIRINTFSSEFVRTGTMALFCAFVSFIWKYYIASISITAILCVSCLLTCYALYLSCNHCTKLKSHCMCYMFIITEHYLNYLNYVCMIVVATIPNMLY